jgi:hypothetical protein
MLYRKYGTLATSLGAIALLLAADEASARAAGTRGAFALARPINRPLAAHAFRHHRGNVFWPGVGGTFYGPDGAPITEVTPPSTSSDVHYTYTYDVPWDWAHRYPPNVTPSDRPYVPGCSAEPVTVPGRNGGEHVVNVTRCY